MKKLEQVLSKWLLPIAAKLEENPQLAAVRRGMMTLVPVTLVGSIPTIFAQLPSIPGMPKWFVDATVFLGGNHTAYAICHNGVSGIVCSGLCWVLLFTAKEGMGYWIHRDIHHCVYYYGNIV